MEKFQGLEVQQEDTLLQFCGARQRLKDQKALCIMKSEYPILIFQYSIFNSTESTAGFIFEVVQS